MTTPALGATGQLARTVARRLTQGAVLRGAAVGLFVAALLVLRPLVVTPLLTAAPSVVSRVGTEVIIALLLALTGGGVGGWWHRHRRGSSPPAVAAAIEQGVPASRNLLRTALELAPAEAPRAEATVHAVVLARAEVLAAQVDARRVVPLRRQSQQAALAGAAWGLGVVIGLGAPDGALARGVSRAVALATQAVRITRVDVAITPPAYVRQPVTAPRDPQQLDALEGSQLRFVVAANADSLRIETPDRVRMLARPAAGDFTWQDTLRADGFVALTPFGERAGGSRLMVLSMRRDGAPLVRIMAPGKDLLLPTAERTLDVRIEASDDVGLGTLQLRYTRVSGSGERFEFSEGTLPVQVTRASPTQWTARAALALAPLLTEPGDLVVYRARATDARPGRAAVESDAFIAQLAEAGGVAALGFSMDPDEERYAVSQQMVIQKTERLLAGQRALARDTIRERAAQIAVEQRRVRAEFVFMTGGEFEAGVVETEEGATQLDESAEADAEQDLAAGRMVNRGRQALLTAIRAMSRASIALVEQRLEDALRQERTALVNLQEAFARQRFLMRALSQREALDPARRHTGVFDSLARVAMPAPRPEPDGTRDSLRTILAALVQPPAAGARERDIDLARRVLLARVSRPDAQREARRVAQWLTRAAERPAAAAALRDSAAAALTAWIAAGSGTAAAAPPAALARQRQALRAGGVP